MFGKIIETLTSVTQVTFYDQNGKKAKVGRSVMVQMPTGTGKTYVMAGKGVIPTYMKKLTDITPLNEDMVMVKRASI